jgi:Holliday junction resolvase RusA-like endonuclease
MEVSIEEFKSLQAKGVFKSHRRRHTPGEMTSSLPPSGTIRFTILGAPPGKPRMTRRDKWKKRDNVLRYREWSDAARQAAGSLPPPEAITRLDWIAVFRPAASWSAQKRLAAMGTLHRQKPDRDNIDKAVLDALFDDDSAVACGTITKIWGENERLEVTIIYAMQDIANGGATGEHKP